MPNKDETHSIEDAICTKETTDALLCEFEGKELWIPKSQITEESEVQGEGEEGMLVVTQWLAEKEGLV